MTKTGTMLLREAFNAVASPQFTCMQALMHYERAHDAESQVLTFSGRAADGTLFTVRSRLIRPEEDINEVAGATALELISKEGVQPP